MGVNWHVGLLEPGKLVIAQVGSFLIDVMLVLIIFLIGWILSNIVKTVISKLLAAAKFDVLSERIELKKLLANGGITAPLSDIVGIVCYWLGILITFVVAVNAIGLTIAADLLSKVVLFVPNVVSAIFIIIVGMFAVTFLQNIVRTAAANAGITQVNLLIKMVEIVIMIFVVTLALEQLKISIRIIEMTIGILLGSLGLGLALSFGIGCKDIAAKIVNDFIEKVRTHK